MKASIISKQTTCMVDPCIEWCLTSWWMCLNKNRWWRRSIEIRSNEWSHWSHLTNTDTSSNVISKHPHNSMTNSMIFHSFQYRRQTCTLMESRDMLREERHCGQSERGEHTKAHIWSCTSSKVFCLLFIPSIGYSTGILSHSHSSPHSIQTGTIHIWICEYVKWETSKV